MARRRCWRTCRFEVRPGETVAMIGANGAGKSTTMRALAGLLRPVDGDDPAQRPQHRARSRPTASRAGGLALVPEGRQVFPGADACCDNLVLGAHTRARCRSRARRSPPCSTRFPRLRDRLAQPRRAAVRRRAADARDRARADGEAAHPAARRALARACAGDHQRAVRHPRRACATTASPSCWSTRWRRWRSTIADRGYVLESGRIVRADTAAALADDPELEAAYLGRAEAAQ